jgi:hypothetical protein
MLKDIKTSALTKNRIRSLQQVARCRDGINFCFNLLVLISTFAHTMEFEIVATGASPGQ